MVDQLLTSMDGIEALDGVVIVAATNRPEMIDRALLRSGRFERVLHIPPPDEESCREIIKIHTANMPLGKFDPTDFAKKLSGYTGADIEAVCREAALIAMRAGKKTVTKKHFGSAVGRVRATVTPDMLEYYAKLEVSLTSGMESVKRGSDTLSGIESV
jgi:transitional endoplasmic reticulum ATPase